VLQVGLVWLLKGNFHQSVLSLHPRNLESPHLHHHTRSIIEFQLHPLFLEIAFNLLTEKVCVASLSNYSSFSGSSNTIQAAELHDRFHMMNSRLTVVLPIPVIPGLSRSLAFSFSFLNFGQGCSRRKPVLQRSQLMRS
jgi:hypothetical protein